MSDKSTSQKALDAYEDAVKRHIPVREVRVEGRSFRLIIGKPEADDGYDTIEMRR